MLDGFPNYHAGDIPMPRPRLRSHRLAASRAVCPNVGHLEARTLLSVAADYGRLPTSFEFNAGQADQPVRFLAHGRGYALYLTPSASVLKLSRAGASLSGPTAAPAAEPVTAEVRMQLVGADPAARVVGQDKLPGKTNYFLGADPSQWRVGIANYGRVEYQGVYRGIDLAYHGEQGQLEYDFDVAPGANPAAIALKFEGAKSMALDAAGALILHAAGGDLVQRAPVAYQTVGGRRVAVPVRFVLRNDGAVHFALGRYDHSRPVVIDPILSYSTYFGGSNDDASSAIAVDESGHAYVAGYTLSTNFPKKGALQPASGGGYDAFVAELSADGKSLIYSTYLGGSGKDVAYDVALDHAGALYVTGETGSINFPTKNALQPAFGGGANDAFLVKVAPGGSLVYSTYLGGSGADYGMGVATDGAGQAYVAGPTSSPNLKTKNAYQPQYQGGDDDVFVAKLSPDGMTPVYLTYLGGSGLDWGTGIAVDSAAAAYITGFTDSTNFPTVAALKGTNSGRSDVFVTKLNTLGNPSYSTYYGGTKDDQAFAIDVTPTGAAYVTGSTFSTDFRIQAAFQGMKGGDFDGFVFALAPGGSALIYSTYMGGPAFDGGAGIAVDRDGRAYVAGNTASTTFPTMNPIQATYGGGHADGIVLVIGPRGALEFSTYLGGSGDDAAGKIALDRSGAAYVEGATQSTNFPTRNAFQPSNGGLGTYDGFIAKIRGYPLTRSSPSDFDGDVKTDFGIYFHNAFYIKPSSGGAMITQVWGLPGSTPVVGDYDFDGKADFGVFYNNAFYVKPSRGGAMIVVPFGMPGSLPVVGDYDGDRVPDFAVYFNNTFFIKPSNGGEMIVQPWGMPGSTPIVGDYDGDGRADFAVYFHNTFYVMPSGGGATIVQPWGVPGSAPIVGDYDGDGKTDFAIYFHNTFYVKPSGGGPMIVQPWGMLDSTPIAGNYDGDDKTDFAIYFHNTFYIKPSSGGPMIVQPWGMPGSTPLPVPLPYMN
jgi:hypothetical protein